MKDEHQFRATFVLHRLNQGSCPPRQSTVYIHTYYILTTYSPVLNCTRLKSKMGVAEELPFRSNPRAPASKTERDAAEKQSKMFIKGKEVGAKSSRRIPPPNIETE